MPLAQLPRVAFSLHGAQSPDGLEIVPEKPMDAWAYWVSPQAGVLVACKPGGEVVSIGLDDGVVRREIDAQGRLALDGSAARPFLIVAQGHAIEMYEVREPIAHPASEP
jgi:hypothetical protein